MGKFQIIRIVEGIFIVLDNDDKFLGTVQWATYNGLMWYTDKDRNVLHTSTGNWPHMPHEELYGKIYENLEKFYG